MLKKFFKECPYLVITLLLLEIAGTVIIFLGAFADVPIIARCLLLIMGIVCIVGSVAAWVIVQYEFEKLEILKQLRDDMVGNEGVE